MLTSIEITGDRPGSLLTLPIGGVSSDPPSPIQIRNIDGLGPVNADIATVALTNFEESYAGVTVGKRNIVFTFGLNPDWNENTIESLRALLYTYFMPRQKISSRFISTHMPTCEIEGYIENFQPNLFSKEPEIQMSVICPKPDFVAISTTTETGLTTTTSGFPDPIAIDYAGTVNAPFDLETHCAAGESSATNFDVTLEFAMSVVGLSWTVERRFSVFVPLLDDTLFFQMRSTPGDKYVRSVGELSGTITNLLNGILPTENIWPVLRPGVNYFNHRSGLAGFTGRSGLHWTMTYYARFGGL